jgi:hypothetical protein
MTFKLVQYKNLAKKHRPSHPNYLGFEIFRGLGALRAF